MLNVVMLCVSMPSVVTLNAIMLSAVVPMEGLPNTLAYYSQLLKMKSFLTNARGSDWTHGYELLLFDKSINPIVSWLVWETKL